MNLKTIFKRLILLNLLLIVLIFISVSFESEEVVRFNENSYQQISNMILTIWGIWMLVYLISLVGSRWNPHEISFRKCLCPVHGPDNECDRVRHPPSYHRSSSSGMFYLPIIEPWTSKGFSCGRLENLRNAHQYVPDTHLCATRSDASCIAHFEEV